MKIAIVGAGAMGSLFGALLAAGKNDVTLIDVYQPAVDAINTNGLQWQDKEGNQHTTRLGATTTPTSVGTVDLIIIFVKCYHTADAVRGALPLLGPSTIVLSLQNGWGNAPKIQSVVGAGRVLVGVTYHSATVIAPGVIKQAGRGRTVIGEWNGATSERVQAIAEAFRASGIEVETSDNVLTEIWSKLALNCCTLPTAALLNFTSDELIKHPGTLELMSALLREVVAVAHAQNVPLDYDERWNAITGLLSKAIGGKASMLQDVQARRRTEIAVINGAVVDAGKRLDVPTPHNQTMVWLIQALEETFAAV